MGSSKSDQTIISIGPGMRGIERGIAHVIGEPKVAAYVEIEAFIIENMVKQMEQGILDPAPIWIDIKTFPAASFYGKIHGIVAGYPCQPFSIAGQRKGANDPRHIWPHIRRAIRAIRPVWCFFENVEGHLTLGYDQVYKELRDLGYRVEAGIFSANEVGAPHQRKRLFILALEHSESWKTRTFGNHRGEKETTVTSRSSSEMVNANCNSDRIKFGDVRKTKSKTQGEAPERKRLRNRFSNSGQTMADTVGLRSIEGWSEFASSQFGKNGKIGFDQSWPSSHGELQKEWEASRVIESGMGCSINGYDFREDLLRMYGNGVVEQAAAFAFGELLSKHRCSSEIAQRIQEQSNHARSDDR